MKHKVRSTIIIFSFIVLAAPVTFAPPSSIIVGANDFYGTPPAGVSDVAAALGLQVDGQVTGLFAGESLTAVLGPNEAGKSTLLGGHGFAAGDKVRITNAGGGKLKIDRLAPDGSVKIYINTQVQDYYSPQTLGEVSKSLGLKSSGPVNGLLKEMSMTAVFTGPESGPLAANGFSPGDKVKLTNIGEGTLEVQRTGPGTPLSIHIQMDEFFSPQTLNEITQVLGLRLQDKAKKLATNESLSASVTTSDKSSLLSTRGFSTGDKVKITNAGGGKMQIERVGSGSPLSIHINMEEFFSSQLLNETAKALGMKLQGRTTLMAPNMTLEAIIGESRSGKSTLLSKKGFQPKDKVQLTNTGGGRLKIERTGAGTPLSIDIKMDEFYTPGPVVR